jgi:hypothetical protein
MGRNVNSHFLAINAGDFNKEKMFEINLED